MFFVAFGLAVATLAACSEDPAVRRDSNPADEVRGRVVSDLFIMYSANAPRDAPATFKRFLTNRDYVRIDSIPSGIRVARRLRYALPTTLRVEWKGEHGVRYWTRRGCGRGTPGTIVYDPEFRTAWTPPEEMDDLVASIRKAARLVRATGCHRFAIAPGAEPFFGLDPDTCEVDLDKGVYRSVPWRAIDLVDFQAQRLLSDRCRRSGGVARYEETVFDLAAFVTDANPEIEVVSQVSFLDTDPSTMNDAIRRVAGVIDGIYFSYPSTNPWRECLYCTVDDLEALLGYLRPTRT
ncbi:MAG: hypothetical protein KY391_06730 [Actinobacteria bacterium]|nr:hypothetical protein [Actinomycetota bacterium]